MMTTIDLYTSKYDGESEVFLRERTSLGEVVFEVHLFAADFSSIMGWIQFDSLSDPDSVIFNFNVDMNWGIQESECKRLQEFYDQLQSISSSVVPEDTIVYNAICDICLSAIQNGNKLYYEG